jgi:hypothetical protein
MADVEFAHHIETAGTQSRRQQTATDFVEVASRARAMAQDTLGSVTSWDDGDFEIAVEIAGGPEAVHVDSPARPGAVKGTVEKVLRDLGLKKL